MRIISKEEVTDPTCLKIPGGIACTCVGVSGTTSVVIANTDEGWIVRQGVAIMGSTGMTDEQMEACNFDPFHEKWHDNFAQGKGDTREKALEAFIQDKRSLAESLF